MVPNHATQTDPYLHEPKGISAAVAGTTYVANGTGSGTWTTSGTTSAFSNSTITGLSYTLTGGVLRSVSSLTSVAGVTLTLTDASTNYIYVDVLTGIIGFNTTGYLPNQLPIWTVITTAGAVTSNTDKRGQVVDSAPTTYAAVAMTDANITLSAFQYSNAVVKLTGTLTLGRQVIVPVRQPPTFFVNGTGQILTVIGATGTGIAVASAKTARVCGDGTNIIRLTADV